MAGQTPPNTGDTPPAPDTHATAQPTTTHPTKNHWQVNFLSDELPTAHPGGWWLIQQRIEHLHDGFSSCDMALWGADPARPPIVSRQAIAVYM